VDIVASACVACHCVSAAGNDHDTIVVVVTCVVAHSVETGHLKLNAKNIVGAGVVDEFAVCDVVQVDTRPRAHTGTSEIAIADCEVDPSVANAYTVTGCTTKVDIKTIDYIRIPR
jgi:hypothetical protein